MVRLALARQVDVQYAGHPCPSNVVLLKKQEEQAG
jgi:hypothetical protein